MEAKEVEQWLLQESKNNNTLAKSYLSMLENATPDMRNHWLKTLGTMLGVVIAHEPELKKHLNVGK